MHDLICLGDKMHDKRLLILYLLIIIIAIPQANALGGFPIKAISAISKSVKVLPEDEIIRLSKLSDEIQGTKKVGKVLGKLNLSDDILEDAFLRIAIHQNKLTRESAEGMFSRLSNTPGFRTTMRKVIGNSNVGTHGHLNELRIADIASMNGFTVAGIGEQFVDGIKKSPTDIDILLEKGGKTFAVEAKNYAKTTKIPMDKYRADLDTLVIYKGNNDEVIPVFTITNKPDELLYMERLEHEANKRGVQLLFGTPQEQIEQVKMLWEIL
jgi:hypothetical protein